METALVITTACAVFINIFAFLLFLHSGLSSSNVSDGHSHVFKLFYHYLNYLLNAHEVQEYSLSSAKHSAHE